jgi:hypothetical protein
MSVPFIPPSSRERVSDEHHEQPEQPVTIMLSPPLAAIVAQMEALRASFNAQIDAVLAQVHAVAYTGAAINNARGGRARSAGDAPAMPATFGASPRPREASPSDAGASHARQSGNDGHDGSVERVIEKL